MYIVYQIIDGYRKELYVEDTLVGAKNLAFFEKVSDVQKVLEVRNKDGKFIYTP